MRRERLAGERIRAALSSVCLGAQTLVQGDGSDLVNFHLRIPEDLHQLLRDSADTEERSLQREIVYRLRKSFVGEVASARTREVAAEVPEVPTDMSDIRGEPITVPVSLPDSERADRHMRCLKRTQHHIYHGGNPCPLCGYPA